MERRVIVSLFACAAAALVACQQSPTRPSERYPDVSLTGRMAADSQAQASSSEPKLLAAIRAATAKFHNVSAALAAGYVDDGYGCVDAVDFGLDPSLGGMGRHLINDALHADPEIDPLRPDLLVYDVSSDGHWTLVALEYEIFRDDWANAGHTTPPTLLGHEFESLDLEDLRIYALHLWLWRENPNGMFVDFNPKVRLCQ